MTDHQLPDRRIEIPIKRLQQRHDLPAVDGSILEELEKRPATTGFIADAIGEQSGYVSQRLADLTDEGLVTQLRRGYYEVNARVVVSGNEVSNSE